MSSCYISRNWQQVLKDKSIPDLLQMFVTEQSVIGECSFSFNSITFILLKSNSLANKINKRLCYRIFICIIVLCSDLLPQCPPCFLSHSFLQQSLHLSHFSHVPRLSFQLSPSHMPVASYINVMPLIYEGKCSTCFLSLFYLG